MIKSDLKRGLNEYDTKEVETKFNQGDFIRVADICTDDLEEAYTLTQNYSESWTLDSRAKRLSGKREYTRSTTTGDVFVRDGRFYCVSSFGFTEFNKDK